MYHRVYYVVYQDDMMKLHVYESWPTVTNIKYGSSVCVLSEHEKTIIVFSIRSVFQREYQIHASELARQGEANTITVRVYIRKVLLVRDIVNADTHVETIFGKLD